MQIVAIIFTIYSSLLYNVAKAVTDTIKSHPEDNKLLDWLKGKGLVEWASWVHCDPTYYYNQVKFSSYFGDAWHWCEWIKEFAFYGCIFVNMMVVPQTFIEVIIRGLSLLFSFWLGGQLFYYLYHSILNRT
jgi:hypothetical protein